MAEINWPEVPERGMFWRISGNIFLGDKPLVMLRRKVLGVLSTEVRSMWTEREFDTYEEEVEYLAHRILNEYHRDQYLHQKALEYRGDYERKRDVRG